MSPNNRESHGKKKPPPPVPFVPPKFGVQEFPVKIASPDVILFDSSLVQIESMVDLIFENMGGQEIINIARNDLVNGQSISYKPIKNINDLALKYNALTLASLHKTLVEYFNNFSINLLDKLPENGEGTGPNGEIIYLEDATDRVILNFINMNEDEYIEVEVIEYNQVFNDTIYEG